MTSAMANEAVRKHEASKRKPRAKDSEADLATFTSDITTFTTGLDKPHPIHGKLTLRAPSR